MVNRKVIYWHLFDHLHNKETITFLKLRITLSYTMYLNKILSKRFNISKLLIYFGKLNYFIHILCKTRINDFP